MTEEFIKMIGVACVTTITTMILKQTKPELAFAVSLVGTLIIVFWVAGLFRGTVNILYNIAATTGLDDSLLKILLKIVGISYLTEFSVGILNDFGSASVADKVSLGGKILIFVLSLPIMESLLKLLQEFLALL